MAWYQEAVFYHIYPLGLTGAPKLNAYGEPEHRLNTLLPWIGHIQKLGCTALYIGPLFESVGHGYETTDYRKLDSRLGTNEDLKNFVDACHKAGIRVVLDGVFNHTGRDFFAFQDIREKRENSPYVNWYCNVNFWNNNEYNDGFSYDNWGGYNLLAKLNQRNPEVQGYIADVIRFWVSEFDIDGIRLDAADVLDFDFMRMLRRVANEVKPEFWLMGEVIHGDYSRWVGGDMLHAVTNYTLHKGLYSGHNDHNYFEIAHTVRRLEDMTGHDPNGLGLYNFTDNHDVERIHTKLYNKAHMIPVHILSYTLPGVPSIYYGSEFGIDGKKMRGSDDSLRPAIDLNEYADAFEKNPYTRCLAALGKVRKVYPALSYGVYKERVLTNRQYAFTRTIPGQNVIVAVNNDDNEAQISVPADGVAAYRGTLTGTQVQAENGWVQIHLAVNSGDVYVPADAAEAAGTEEAVLENTAAVPEIRPAETQPKAEKAAEDAENEKDTINETAAVTDVVKATAVENASAEKGTFSLEKLTQDSIEEAFKTRVRPLAPEELTVEELQISILERMRRNGPVNEQMKRTVTDNTHHGSLVNWLKSFR
ncbi:MAG: alpha-amylase family glycosyl hydrolase [Eubacteriales bacterium]|nr:alpha-amylase family glycosyl hydrolase [Eubacteriales bacterium]